MSENLKYKTTDFRITPHKTFADKCIESDFDTSLPNQIFAEEIAGKALKKVVRFVRTDKLSPKVQKLVDKDLIRK